MMKLDRIGSTTLLCLCLLGTWNLAHAQATHEAPAQCAKFTTIDHKASQPLQGVTLPPARDCAPRTGSKGFLIPDPTCTPGAINPTLTAAVLKDPEFTTKCVRNETTTEEQKNSTYGWYHIKHPAHNEGATQTCELDHLISLELGGADTLDNLWPQCGPDGVPLNERFFKHKDLVEDHLAVMVKEGKMELAEAQQQIARDWTQFIDAAKTTCSTKHCKPEPDHPEGK